VSTNELPEYFWAELVAVIRADQCDHLKSLLTHCEITQRSIRDPTPGTPPGTMLPAKPVTTVERLEELTAGGWGETMDYLRRLDIELKAPGGGPTPGDGSPYWDGLVKKLNDGRD
jgi:hypothetical protein